MLYKKNNGDASGKTRKTYARHKKQKPQKQMQINYKITAKGFTGEQWQGCELI